MRFALKKVKKMVFLGAFATALRGVLGRKLTSRPTQRVAARQILG